MEKNRQDMGAVESLQKRIEEVNTMDDFNEFIEELIKESDKKRKR